MCLKIRTKGKEVNKMNNFNVDDLLKDLETWNTDHDKDLNPTKSEKELMELKSMVKEYKEWRKNKEEANRNARKIAVDKSNNSSVDKYVAMCTAKKKEFKENYF